MLYSDHPILGPVFTSPPWKIFLCASAAACLFLLLPAIALGLHSIPTAKGNLGLLFSYNWSLMYPVVIPLLLAMTVAVSERMRDCVAKLEENGRISSRSAIDSRGYAEALTEYLRSRARILLLVVLVISVLVTLIDTYNLWIGFLPGHLPPPSRKPEWDTAFNVMNWGAAYASPEFSLYLNAPPSKAGNLFFDLVAYIFQGTAYFLLLFWIGKFFLFLTAFAQLIGGANPSYQFNPLTDDLDLRMGLKPMGRLFDNFLAITLIIEGYAFYHRLHLIKLANNQPLMTYVTRTMSKIVFPEQSATVPYPLTHLTELFKKESWALNGLDVSAILTIVFMSVPIFVVCFLPLWKIRTLIEQRRTEEMEKLQKEHSAALAARNFDRVQLVQYEKQSLEQANIWPNGDLRARQYLTVILALAAGALAPPLLAIVLVLSFSRILPRYFRNVFHK